MISSGESYDLKVPENIQRAAAHEGGLNRYGTPNYRIVWGWSRKELRAGLMTIFDDSGNDISREMVEEWQPKYWPRDRFHMEVWVPPESYGTPEQWTKDTAATVNGTFVHRLGAYPDKGDYEHLFTCQGRDGEFVMPTEAAVIEVIRWHKRLRNRTSEEIQADIDEEIRQSKETRQQRYRDIIDSEVKAFPWRIWMPVSGQLPKRLEL